MVEQAVMDWTAPFRHNFLINPSSRVGLEFYDGDPGNKERFSVSQALSTACEKRSLQILASGKVQ